MATQTTTRKGRKSKLSAVKDNLAEETPELVNGASVKDRLLQPIDVSIYWSLEVILICCHLFLVSQKIF